MGQQEDAKEAKERKDAKEEGRRKKPRGPTGENGDNIALVGPIKAIHDHLMGPGDEIEIVLVVELGRDVGAEGVSGAAGGDIPAGAFVGVGPDKVAQRAVVRHLLQPIKLADLVDGVEEGREAAVHAEDAVVDEGGRRQVVEEVGQGGPDRGAAVFAEALVVEAVDLGDLADSWLPRRMVMRRG